jgi:hypothetical protein
MVRLVLSRARFRFSGGGTGGRSFVAVLTVAIAVVAFAQAPAAAAVVDAPPPVEPQQQDELALARRTGEPVEVAAKTTETTQVMANPDGTFTLRSSAEPTRVKKDGAWRDIDTTLTARTDGTIAPVASTTDVRFSRGGTAPVITAVDGDKRLALRWPTPLPEPVLSENTATYREVFPGVDLQVAANVSGFSEVLVVHSAEAAENPALAAVSFAIETTGLTLSATEDGTLNATDAQGSPVFSSSTPIMWDSTPGDTTATATDPGSGQVTPITVTVSGKPGASTVSVVPDLAALTGPDVTYPVYIDPVMSRGKNSWAEVTSNGWHYFNDPMEAQVGFCSGWDGCGSPAWVARSYFSMPTSDLMPRNGLKPVLYSAFFYALQTHGAHLCVAEPVELWTGGGIDVNTRWPGPAGRGLDTQSSGAGDQCGGAGSVRFNAQSGVQEAIDNNWSALTLLLKSPSEGQPLQWKKFANNPTLEATFSFPPNAATGSEVAGAVTCFGKVITSSASPTLYATATDNNVPPLNLGLWYEVWNGSGTTRYASTTSAVISASGARAGWAATPALADGDYAYRVAVENSFPGDSSKNLWAGIWSPWLWFTVHAKPVAGKPEIVDSYDYPRNSWGAQAGSPGSISVEHFGAQNLVGFSYTFDGAGTERVPGTTDCDYNRTFGSSAGWVAGTSSATIQIPAGLTPGYHTMYVKSFDDAHKMSAESDPYVFYVAPNTGNGGSARIEAESLTVTQPAGQNVSTGPQPNCCNVSFSGGSQLYIGGTAEGQSFDLSFTVATEANYVLGMAITSAGDYGEYAYFIDGTPLGHQFSTVRIGPFDNYNPVVAVDYYSMGTRRLTAGTHKLTLQVTGTNSASVGARYLAGIDYLTLAATSRYEAEEPSQVTVSQPADQDSDVGPQEQNCCSGLWSEAGQINFNSSTEDVSFDLAFRVPIEADYSLAVALTKDNYAGRLQISVDGKAVGGVWDGYTDDWPHTELLGLGGVHLKPGEHKLTFRVVGSDEESWGYGAGVDYFIAVPINNVTVADFPSALNNDGIAPDGTLGKLDWNSTGLSAQTLAAVGLAPGATKMINGAAFTMPQHTANGFDNVVAFGQKIPVAPVKASAYGLLATSTCGTAPSAMATITYTDGTTQDSRVPEVTDWAFGATDAAAFVLPYRTKQAAVDDTIKPRLYTVFFPADPRKTISSITLPNYGTTTLLGCDKPSLSVFAMAPRTQAIGWVGAWSAPADALTVPPGGVGFLNQTVRTVVTPSATGASVRIKLANPMSAVPMTVGAASIGAQASSDAATLATPTALTFAGTASVVIPAGGEVLSDPVTFPSTTGGSGNLVVSLNFTTTVARAPVHAFTTTQTYLASGNQTATTQAAPFSTSLSGTYYFASLDVSTTDSGDGTVVVLGDQFAASTGTDRATWVDKLPSALGALGESVPGGVANASRAGLPATGRWRFSEGAGTTAANSASATTPLTLTSSTTWSTERGGAIVLNGTNAYGATTSPIVSTTKSYTVAAWVKLTSTADFYTALGQGGANHGGFFLQYNRNFQAWTLISPSQDAASPSDYYYVTGPAPVLNTWTHLAGTFDATTGTMSLYVNGRLVGSTFNPTPFDTNGPFTVGAMKLANGAVSNYWPGSIANVRAYREVASADDVAAMYRDLTATGLGAPSATSAPHTIDRTVLCQPNVRTVIVSLGVSDLLAGHGKDQILRDLTAISHPASATGLGNYRRSDGTPVHVILTTVPALGLAADDTREQTRVQLNAALLADYTDLGADGIIDIAAAVSDPTAANAVAPNLLTNGTPNNAFYDTIAQTIARAVANFPPLEL